MCPLPCWPLPVASGSAAGLALGGLDMLYILGPVGAVSVPAAYPGKILYCGCGVGVLEERLS